MAGFVKDKEYYSEKAEYYAELCKASAQDFSSSIAHAEESAQRRELSRGGGTIHRGYYCPSPIKDRVIGGCKRGRLISKLPSKPDTVYEYFFNASGEMTLANKYAVERGQMYYLQSELITRNDSTARSFVLKDVTRCPHISGISECSYDNGLISSYEYAAIIGRADNAFCASIDSERYWYDKNRLITCFMDSYICGTEILQSLRYDFIYGDGDTPTGYTLKKYVNGEYRASADPERVYELLKR